MPVFIINSCFAGSYDLFVLLRGGELRVFLLCHLGQFLLNLLIWKQHWETILDLIHSVNYWIFQNEQSTLFSRYFHIIYLNMCHYFHYSLIISYI